MSAFPSAYINDKILDKVLRNTNFTSPASLYVALYTEDPTSAGTGDEVTGGSYARQVVTFAAASGGAITSNVAAVFAGLPAATITHYGVLDALTAGNLIIFGALPNTIAANSGDQITIGSGELDITVSGS